LRESEDRYRSLVEHSPDVLWTLAEGKRAVFTSRNVERICGFSGDELSAGGLDFWLGRVQPEERERVRQACAALTSELVPYDVEYRWQRKDGRWIWIQGRGLASELPGGGQRVHGIFSDVTQRKQLEERLGQAQRMEAIGRLTGGVAHDFNNLLAAILANVHFLLEDLPADDPCRADAGEILAAAERAATLTRQLLAFSRRQVLQPVVLDLNAVVEGLGTMLRRLIGENIALVSHSGPDLGAVRADPGQIEQVLVNLAVNARDAMPTGGHLVLETANVEVGPDEGLDALRPGRYVMVAVTDTGGGMSAETLGRIFEPFFTTKGQRGTGLGLATCYGIVKQSGGHIWVSSELGRGTTFKIYLPRVDGRPETAAPPTALARGGTERILVVEDDAKVRAAVERILAARGYTVLVAGNGDEALALAASQPVDRPGAERRGDAGRERPGAAPPAARGRHPRAVALHVGLHRPRSAARRRSASGRQLHPEALRAGNPGAQGPGGARCLAWNRRCANRRRSADAFCSSTTTPRCVTPTAGCSSGPGWRSRRSPTATRCSRGWLTATSTSCSPTSCCPEPTASSCCAPRTSSIRTCPWC
jgi:PAS domain S-box-containing protein